MRDLTLEQVLANTRRVGKCRRWKGTVKKKTGLPQIGIHGRRMYVTRLVWELQHGRALVADESIVHVHACKYNDCVEPSHLLKVPSSETWRYRKSLKWAA